MIVKTRNNKHLNASTKDSYASQPWVKTASELHPDRPVFASDAKQNGAMNGFQVQVRTNTNTQYVTYTHTHFIFLFFVALTLLIPF